MIIKIEKTYGIDNQFNGYRMNKNNVISLVPLEPANTDYQAIQKWIAEGGVVIDNGGNN